MIIRLFPLVNFFTCLIYLPAGLLSVDSFIKCPAKAFQFDRRLEYIVEEIKTFSADLICLQEVDMYDQLKSRLTGRLYIGS